MTGKPPAQRIIQGIGTPPTSELSARSMGRLRPQMALAEALLLGGEQLLEAIATDRRRRHVRVSAPRSRSRSVRLASRPALKPVSEPSAPITRWQGTTIESGL